jgi:hypothetical protein
MGAGTRAELVRDAVDAFNRGDVEWIERNATEDFEMVAPISAITGRSYRGRTGLREWMRDIDEIFEERGVKLDEVSEQRNGDVFARGRINLQLRGQGTGGETQVWYAASFGADDRICRWVSSVEGPAKRGD